MNKLPAWKRDILETLRERNNVENHTYKHLFESYRKMSKSYQFSSMENKTLHKELGFLQHKLSELSSPGSHLYLPPVTAAAASVGDGSPHAQLTKRIHELERKLYAMQDELTSCYRAKANASEAIVNMTNHFSELEQRLENATDEKDRLSIRVHQQAKEIQVLQKEADSLLDEIQRRDDEITTLDKEKTALLRQLEKQRRQEEKLILKIHELRMALATKIRKNSNISELISALMNPHASASPSTVAASIATTAASATAVVATATATTATTAGTEIETATEAGAEMTTESSTSTSVSTQTKYTRTRRTAIRVPTS